MVSTVLYTFQQFYLDVFTIFLSSNQAVWSMSLLFLALTLPSIITTDQTGLLQISASQVWGHGCRPFMATPNATNASLSWIPIMSGNMSQ